MVEWRYSSTILDLSFRPLQIYSRGKSPLRTNCLGGWMGPRTGVDALKMRKFCPTGNPTPAVQSVARRYTDWAILSSIHMPVGNSIRFEILMGVIMKVMTFWVLRPCSWSKSKKRAELSCLLLLFPSILKMEAISSSEWPESPRTTWHWNPTWPLSPNIL
jgi:hypothetical protein